MVSIKERVVKKGEIQAFMERKLHKRMYYPTPSKDGVIFRPRGYITEQELIIQAYLLSGRKGTESETAEWFSRILLIVNTLSNLVKGAKII